MKKLVVKFEKEVDYVGTKKYVIYEDEQSVATIYTRNNRIEEVAHEYWKEMKTNDKYELIIEYDTNNTEEEGE